MVLDPSQNPFFEKEPPKSIWHRLSRLMFFVITIFSLTLVVSWFTVLGQNQVDGPSMQPNFFTGEFLIVNRIPALTRSGYERGDVIIYQKPGFAEFVKRVIALPGETIEIRNCFVLINGRRIKEFYLPAGVCTNSGTFLTEGTTYTVPAGHYITIGDNRQQSVDSRDVSIGFTKEEWIKGVVFLRIWPSDKISLIERGRVEFID